MSASKNPNTYPIEFWDILSRVEQGRDSIKFRFATMKEAQAERLKWYGFVAALKKLEAEAAKRSWRIIAKIEKDEEEGWFSVVWSARDGGEDDKMRKEAMRKWEENNQIEPTRSAAQEEIDQAVKNIMEGSSDEQKESEDVINRLFGVGK